MPDQIPTAAAMRDRVAALLDQQIATLELNGASVTASDVHVPHVHALAGALLNLDSLATRDGARSAETAAAVETIGDLKREADALVSAIRHVEDVMTDAGLTLEDFPPRLERVAEAIAKAVELA